MKMTSEQGDKYLNEILDQTRETLGVKALMYVRNNDRMHNFNVGAKMKGIPREEVLDSFRLKHEISRIDIINDLKEGKLPSKDLVMEKYGDLINYYVLECMSMLHRIEKNE